MEIAFAGLVLPLLLAGITAVEHEISNCMRKILPSSGASLHEILVRLSVGHCVRELLARGASCHIGLRLF
ncbi:hypothetical protein [Pandoraea soli]|uniref:hypothetical protein n=1 Tax=Pandoraea soli TaxID=2508293 RepID=UPI001241E4F1|nr:hypothetical protein [Pandoraea soli]